MAPRQLSAETGHKGARAISRRGYFVCRDRDNVIIKCGILKYECRELKCNSCVSEKKSLRLAQSIFTSRAAGNGGCSRRSDQLW